MRKIPSTPIFLKSHVQTIAFAFLVIQSSKPRKAWDWVSKMGSWSAGSAIGGETWGFGNGHVGEVLCGDWVDCDCLVESLFC
jgi:hypothetical protein